MCALGHIGSCRRPLLYAKEAVHGGEEPKVDGSRTMLSLHRPRIRRVWHNYRRLPQFDEEKGAPMFAGKIGIPELMLILGIALLIFGPRKLVDLGKSLGEGIRGFKFAMKDVDSDPTKL